MSPHVRTHRNPITNPRAIERTSMPPGQGRTTCDGRGPEQAAATVNARAADLELVTSARVASELAALRPLWAPARSSSRPTSAKLRPSMILGHSEHEVPA